jgi:hypothetical protein
MFFWAQHKIFHVKVKKEPKIRHFCTEFNIQTHFELVVTSTLTPHLAQQKFIQNGVNIQDGDFSFCHQSVWALYFRHFETYKLQIFDSDIKLYTVTINFVVVIPRPLFYCVHRLFEFKRWDNICNLHLKLINW